MVPPLYIIDRFDHAAEVQVFILVLATQDRSSYLQKTFYSVMSFENAQQWLMLDAVIEPDVMIAEVKQILGQNATMHLVIWTRGIQVGF